MVKVGQKLGYACRVAIQLAKHYDKMRVSKIDDLAALEAVSPNFLVQILSDLRRGGVVSSRRGKLGGYLLARPPAEISLADIVRAVEGDVLEVDFDRGGDSGERVAEIWRAMADELARAAEALSLLEMTRGEDALEYHI